MSRPIPCPLLRFIASIAVLVLLTTYSPARAQQKPALAPPHSQTQLEDRVKELEARANAAEQKAALAAMEKDYITRVQKQYETYYEKAFNSQIVTLTILGLIIGLVGKFGLDRVVQHKLGEASAQLRTEFSQQLRTELETLRQQLKTLEDGLTNRITQQEQDLTTQSRYQFDFAQGLTAMARGHHADARDAFRRVLRMYKSGRPRQLIPAKGAAIALANLFCEFWNEDQANFVENATKELADEFYNDLEAELALAAVTLTELAPLLKERKWAQSPLPAAES